MGNRERVKENKVQRYYPVRFSLRSEEAMREFRQMETLMVMEGINVSEFWEDLVKGYVSRKGWIMEGQRVVTVGELMEEAKKIDFGIQITPVMIFVIRNRDWVRGVDYWVAESGEGKIYRYDLDRCLERLRERYGDKRLEKSK